MCEQARLSRDARFDGLFFTAVKTTGIYCRPVCPAPPPKAGNVCYYATAAAATQAGYRPCLRCRPELAPAAWRYCSANQLVQQGLQLIEAGLLDNGRMADLAARLGVGERQLRRLFQQELGVAPLQVALNRRLLFAKQLLHDSHLPITDIALAAGFGSVRRFNDAWQKSFGLNPTQLRRTQEQASSSGQGLTLRLAYRPPYDFSAMLDFLRRRAIAGVEVCTEQQYARVVHDGLGHCGWITVSDIPGRCELRVALHRLMPRQIFRVLRGVRQLFDIDADSEQIEAHLQTDPALVSRLQATPGIRVPGCIDGFEIAVRAVVGQQVSLAAARTLIGRIIQRCGGDLPQALEPGLERRFPTPVELAQADLSDCGLTTARQHSLRTLAQAVVDEQVSLEPTQRLEHFLQAWQQLPGIGPWTAHYLAMRVLHHPDAFPAGDLILRRALVDKQGAPVEHSEAALRRYSERWRPWRAYAALLLWHHSN